MTPIPQLGCLLSLLAVFVCLMWSMSGVSCLGVLPLQAGGLEEGREVSEGSVRAQEGREVSKRSVRARPPLQAGPLRARPELERPDCLPPENVVLAIVVVTMKLLDLTVIFTDFLFSPSLRPLSTINYHELL